MSHCAGKCLIVLIRGSPEDNDNENCCVMQNGSGCAPGLDRFGGLHLAGMEPVRGAGGAPCACCGQLKASDSGMVLGIYSAPGGELL